MIVFATFSLLVLFDMANNLRLADRVNGSEDIPGFTTVYLIGCTMGGLCFVAAIFSLVYSLRSEGKPIKCVSKIIYDCLLSKNIVDGLQEFLFWYNAGITMLALRYGDIPKFGNDFSMVWSTLV